MNSRLTNNPLVIRLQRLSLLAALLAIAVGCLVIVGWLFNIEIFKTVLPTLVAMKFNTALAFTLAGIGLFNLRKQPRITQAMAVVVALLGLLTLCEYIFGWDLGIDQWLVHDAVTPLSNYPGRMSPVTAINFCLMGSGLLLITRTRHFVLAQSLTLIAGFIAMLSLTGYIYGVQSLYRIGLFSSIALHTTLTFIVLGLGIIFANPDRGLTAVIVADRPGALLIRRFLPATIVISLVLAWLQQRGEQAGLYDINFGLALFAMSNTVIFTLLIFWNARSLNRVDTIRVEQVAQRQQADDAVKRYGQRLQMLHDIDTGILEANSIPTVVEVALKHLRLLIPCQRADVTILDETSGDALIFAVGMDGSTELGQGVHVPIPTNFSEGYDARHIRLFDDIRIWQDTRPRARQLVKEGLLCALSVLLMDRERPIGTIGLFAAVPGFFTVEHQEIVVEVAGQIAIAVKQMHLSENLAHHTAELERNVAELMQAEAALLQANELLEIRVGERTSELTQANHTLETQIIQRKSADDRFRALLESAPDAVIIASAHGEIILVNAQTERIFGYTRDELLGQPIEMLIPEPFRSRHPAHRSEYTADPQVRNMGVGLELYALRKDGSQFPVEISLSPIKTDEGVVIASSVRDITDRKQAEDALRANEEQLQAIFDVLPVGTTLMNNNRQIIVVNRALTKILGVSADDLLTGKYRSRHWIRSDGSSLPPSEFPSERALIGQQAVTDVEMGIIKEDGVTIWISASAAPLPRNQGVVIATVDITQRKQVENDLRESEEKLQAVFNLLPVGTSIIDNDRRIISMNPAQEKILGMTMDDIMTGKYLGRKYLHGDGSPVLAGEFTSSRALAEQRVIFDDEIGFIKEDGTTVWTTVSAAPLPGKQGLVMVMADMTERKHVEQEMQRLHIALNTVEEGALLLDFDWRYLYVNAAAAEQGHHPKEAMLGHTLMEMYPGVEQTPLFDVFQRCMEQRVSEHFETAYTFPDNSSGWFDLSIQPIAEGIFILSSNVSERKRIEEAIKHNEQLLRTILDNLPIGVSIIDAAGTVNQTNPAGLQLWASEKYVNIPSYAERKGWWIETGEPVQPDDWAGVRAIIKGETSFNEELEIECLDGAHKFILNSAIPMRDDQHKITGAILVNQDVTKIKSAEIALKKLNDDLHLANEEVQNFAYIVSHDLRSPLINLKGFSELLRASVTQIDTISASILPLLDETQRTVLNTALHEKIPTALRFINTSVDRMDGFTSSILKLSRIGHHQLSFETVSVKDLIGTILQSLAGQITEQGIQVTVEDLPNMRADRTSLDQILGNIITNAMKYLDPLRPGRIRIYSEPVNENTTIHVQDNGRGITEVDYEKVFAPFRRAGRPTVEGEGMGLAYVQALLKRHHGRIWFTSQPDVGSTFSFRIPTRIEARNDTL